MAITTCGCGGCGAFNKTIQQYHSTITNLVTRRCSNAHSNLFCSNSVDASFKASCKLLYYDGKKQAIILRVFACQPGSVLPKVRFTHMSSKHIHDCFATGYHRYD